MLRANEKNRYFGNKLRTILLAACVLSCIGAVSASAQQVGLALNSGSGSRGGRVTLNVSLSDSGGAQPASLEWSMKYSATDITGITVSAGPAASAAEKAPPASSPVSTSAPSPRGLWPPPPSRFRRARRAPAFPFRLQIHLRRVVMAPRFPRRGLVEPFRLERRPSFPGFPVLPAA